MLYYWYQPLITMNKSELNPTILLELPWTQRCIITEQLLHEAEYDMKSYVDRGGIRQSRRLEPGG